MTSFRFYKILVAFWWIRVKYSEQKPTYLYNNTNIRVQKSYFTTSTITLSVSQNYIGNGVKSASITFDTTQNISTPFLFQTRCPYSSVSPPCRPQKSKYPRPTSRSSRANPSRPPNSRWPDSLSWCPRNRRRCRHNRHHRRRSCPNPPQKRRCV